MRDIYPRGVVYHRLLVTGTHCLVVLLLLVLFWGEQGQAKSQARPDPYFASLASNEANVRAGPGLRYPIKWVFERAHLPVEVVDHFNNWRQVRFHTGQEGWAYHSLISSHRYALITGDKPVALHRLPRAQSQRLLLAQPGVIVRLEACRRNWCEAEIAERTGWLPKAFLWGVRQNDRFGE